MRKGREIIGLPVVSLATGKELGLVEELLWDHQGRRITHLVISEKGISKGARLVSFHDILGIGDDAVTVAGDSLPEGVQDPQVDTRTSRLAGLPILTAGGNNVGTIEDVVFESEDGRLLGYEISSGLVGDLVSGRDVLIPDTVITWGEEAVIVNNTQDSRGESDAVSNLQE